MTPDSFTPTLPRMAVRFAIAVAGSLCVHVLFVSGAMRGLADVFHWTRNAEPAPLQVRARLAEAPVIPAPAPAPKPAVRKPAAKPVERTPQPVTPPAFAPEMPSLAQASVPASAPPDEIPAAPPPLLPVQASEAAPVAAPVATPAPPRAQKAIPLPRRATIALELTLESNNYKVWATQQWEMADGRYRVLLTAEAKALFFSLGSILLESSGVVSADGLRPERYVDERNKRRTTVDFSANEKTAYVEEANGNRKTLALAGQAADIMSLTYDLAFNPDINVGAPFTLSNRDTIEEIRLVAKREESLVVESGTRMTRFYDFRRPDGSGGIQVWLSPENGWLPAKIRILGRDGALTMVATRYDLNPPDSR